MNDVFSMSGPLNTYYELTEVKSIVEAVLEKYPHTRNSDNLLVEHVWQIYGRSIKVGTIERVRREIQNKDHKLLPTDPKVFMLRLSRQKEFALYYAKQQPYEFQEVFFGVV